MKTPKFPALALAFLVLFSLMAACSGEDSGGNGGSSGIAADLPDSLENPDLTIVYWQTEKTYLSTKKFNENIFDPLYETIPQFEEKYGGKVTVEVVDWGSMLQRATELQSANNAPDLIEVYDRIMHNVIFSGMVQEIDAYVTDEDFGYWDVDRELFSWKGKTYAIPWKPYLTSIIFNRDLLDRYGLEMPDDLYKRGEWTFDKFVEMVQKTTVYTEGDAEQMGFGSWAGEGMGRFLVANGSAFVNVDSQAGTAVSGLTDQKMLDTIDWMRTWASNPQSGWVTGNDMFGWFDNGGLAFIDGKEYGADEYPFDVGMVPYPAGPGSAYAKPLVVMPQGMAVPKGAKNPEGAVVFMRMLNEIWKDEGLKREAANIGQDYFDMLYNDPEVKMVYAFDKAVDNIDYITQTIANMMGDNTPASTIAETLNPELSASIKQVYDGR